jgi:hypothetical protein
LNNVLPGWKQSPGQKGYKSNNLIEQINVFETMQKYNVYDIFQKIKMVGNSVLVKICGKHYEFSIDNYELYKSYYECEVSLEEGFEDLEAEWFEICELIN